MNHTWENNICVRCGLKRMGENPKSKYLVDDKWTSDRPDCTGCITQQKKYTEEERDRFAIGFFIDAIHKYKMEYVRLKGWHQTDINPDKYYNHRELLDFYKRDLNEDKSKK